MSAVASYLSGKVVFVTGATGFLGKGLVEKLLRQAPGLSRLYLPIRLRGGSAGRSLSAQERMVREVWGSNAFENLRKLWGDRFEALMGEKVVAVPWNLTEDRLGIEPDRYRNLTREVDIVIHCAATVVFDEPLDLALELNTLGTRRILEFAKACRDAVLIQVSTAYVNGQQTGSIPEAPLPANRTIAQMIGRDGDHEFDLEAEIDSILSYKGEVLESSERPELREEFLEMIGGRNRGKRARGSRLEHELEVLTKRWIRRRMVEEGMARSKRFGWHDTYTFTKAMGEQSIVKSRGGLPAAIIRPSIIESSLSDPEPGWLDGLKVADPLISHFGKGRLQEFPADPNIVIDLIPVDIVFNAIIAAIPRAREDGIKVYHVATGSQNPLKVGEMVDLVYEHFRQYPMRDRYGNPIRVHRWRFPSPEKFKRRFRLKYQIPLGVLLWCLDHVRIVPWPARLRRRASVLEAQLDRVLSLAEIYSPYTNLDCRFETCNTQRLFQQLDPEDREIFNFDVSRIRWPEYIQDIHLPGLKRHVLKTSESSAGTSVDGPSTAS